MIKHLLSIAAVAAFAMSASAEVNFTFGSDLEGWKFDVNGGSGVIDNGHVSVEMGEQSNGKWREDMQYKGSDVTIDPAADKIFAFKFIGEMPMANYTFELRDPSEHAEGVKNTISLKVRANNNTANTLTTKGGNSVLYVDLSSNDIYAQWTSPFTPSLFQMKVADVAADAELHSYALDWIKSFASMDDLKAGVDVADDENDTDEGAVTTGPVYNSTTGVSYNTLTEALDASSEGDEIVINEDQVISSRYGLTKPVTISGATGNEVIKGSGANYILFLLTNTAYGQFTFKNLIFEGVGKPIEKSLFEINNSGNSVVFEDVTFRNIDLVISDASKAQHLISQKNGGKAIYKNVSFDDVALAEGKKMIFLGANSNATMAGKITNGSVYLEKTSSKLYVAEEGVTGDPIEVAYQDSREDGAVMVYGTIDIEKFTLTNEGYHLEADVENNNLVLAQGTSGIESVGAENAPAEYYNLQGVKVSEPTPGLYIVRQGGKTSKVVVR